jgi:hypothetical protein
MLAGSTAARPPADKRYMKTRLLLVITAALGVGLMPELAGAQSFSFSIGHGHGHHHHHGWHHYDHCWHDPFWCGPHFDYVYVAPPPVIQREIRYVQPVERVVETRVEAPRVKTTAASTASSNLQIWNACGRRVPVGFLADGQSISLSDGQSHTFYGAGERTIEFDRGGDYGTARVELTGGQYEFVVTSRGWDLVQREGAAGNVAQKATAPRNALPGSSTSR